MIKAHLGLVTGQAERRRKDQPGADPWPHAVGAVLAVSLLRRLDMPDASIGAAQGPEYAFRAVGRCRAVPEVGSNRFLAAIGKPENNIHRVRVVRAITRRSYRIDAVQVFRRDRHCLSPLCLSVYAKPKLSRLQHLFLPCHAGRGGLHYRGESSPLAPVVCLSGPVPCLHRPIFCRISGGREIQADPQLADDNRHVG